MMLIVLLWLLLWLLLVLSHHAKLCFGLSPAQRLLVLGRYETIEESDLVILLISDSAMASNHEKVFSKLKKVSAMCTAVLITGDHS